MSCSQIERQQQNRDLRSGLKLYRSSRLNSRSSIRSFRRPLLFLTFCLQLLKPPLRQTLLIRSCLVLSYLLSRPNRSDSLSLIRVRTQQHQSERAATKRESNKVKCRRAALNLIISRSKLFLLPTRGAEQPHKGASSRRIVRHCAPLSRSACPPCSSAR